VAAIQGLFLRELELLEQQTLAVVAVVVLAVAQMVVMVRLVALA
jgi:hypothetical protein